MPFSFYALQVVHLGNLVDVVVHLFRPHVLRLPRVEETRLIPRSPHEGSHSDTKRPLEEEDAPVWKILLTAVVDVT